MARIESMATIDYALTGGGDPTPLMVDAGNQQPGAQDDLIPTPSVPAPAPASSPTPAKKQASGKEELTEEKKQTAAIENALRQNQDSAEITETQTANRMLQAVRYTGGRLASLPTPGDLIFPIVVLLIFFVLVLPVGGHTRLQWLWLVLSGNAQVSNSSSGDGSGSGSGGSDGTEPTTGWQPVPKPNTSFIGGPGSAPSLPVLTLLSSFTGAEDVS